MTTSCGQPGQLQTAVSPSGAAYEHIQSTSALYGGGILMSAVAEQVRLLQELLRPDIQPGDYLNEPLLGETDQSLRAFVFAFESTGREIRNAASSLVASQSKKIARFGRRMATAAVQSSDNEAVVAGVLALAIAGDAIGREGLLVGLSLLDCSSRRLGSDLRFALRRGENVASGVAIRALNEFSSRPPELRDCREFGFREVMREGLFDYEKV